MKLCRYLLLLIQFLITIVSIIIYYMIGHVVFLKRSVTGRITGMLTSTCSLYYFRGVAVTLAGNKPHLF